MIIYIPRWLELAGIWMSCRIILYGPESLSASQPLASTRRGGFSDATYHTFRMIIAPFGIW